jgi:hypothetical protein
MSLGSSWGSSFLDTPYFLKTQQFWRILVWCFIGNPTIGVVWCFAHDKTRVLCYWREDYRSPIFITSTISMTCHHRCWNWPSGWGDVCRFLHYKFVLFFSFYITLLKQVIIHRSYLRSGELWSYSLTVGYLHKLFGIHVHERFIAYLPFINLYKHLLTSIRFPEFFFYIWVLIHYYFIYFVAQIIPELSLRVHFSWGLHLFDIPCYGQNCVLLKFMYYCPKPQTIFGKRIYRKLIGSYKA